MTLEQQVKNEIDFLSDDDILQVIQFIDFLHFSKEKTSQKQQAESKDEKKYRTRGGLKGEVILADDFNDTPDCFREYV